jgi:hypothetical protein
VEWSEEQAAAAERKVQENSTQRVCPEKQGGPSSTGGSSPRGWRAAPAEILCHWPEVEREGEGTSKEGKGLLSPKAWGLSRCFGFRGFRGLYLGRVALPLLFSSD